MKRPWPWASLLAAWFFAAGALGLFHGLLNLPQPVALVILAPGPWLLLLEAAYRRFRLTLVLLALAVVSGLVFLALLPPPDPDAAVSALLQNVRLLAGRVLEFLEWSRLLILEKVPPEGSGTLPFLALLAAATGLFAWVFAVRIPSPAVLGLAGAGVYLAFWFIWRGAIPKAWLAPMALGAGWTLSAPRIFRRSRPVRAAGDGTLAEFSRWWLLPGLAVVTLAAVLLSFVLPITSLKAGLVRDTVQDAVDALHLGPAWVYRSFTSSETGLSPLRNRLGGPLRLSDDPVMVVATKRPALLAGVYREIYTGYGWGTGLERQAYAWDNTLRLDQRADLFDQARPGDSLLGEDLRKRLFADVRYDVEVRTSLLLNSLPTARRLADIAGVGEDGVLPNYDATGEVFARKPLRNGDRYGFDANVFRSGASVYDDALLAWEARILETVSGRDSDERTRWIDDHYLQLPDSFPDSLRDLSLQVVEEAGANSPYERVMAIRRYLLASCRYETDVPVPPLDRDFVDWFLSEREGYCTYFASAMTTLARAASVPARYVEGYAMGNARALGEDTWLVTNLQAHAWTEVWLTGIGWVPVDATPGGHVPGSAPGLLEPTPTGQPSPTPSPTPTPGEGTPTPRPSLPPRPDPSVTPGPGGDDQPMTFLEALEVFVTRARGLLLALAFLMLWVSAMSWPVRILRRRYRLARLRKRHDPRETVRLYWGYFLRLLASMGHPMDDSQSPGAYIRSLPHSGLGQILSKTARLYSQVQYGGPSPAEADLPELEDAYDRMMDAHSWMTGLLPQRLFLLREALVPPWMRRILDTLDHRRREAERAFRVAEAEERMRMRPFGYETRLPPLQERSVAGSRGPALAAAPESGFRPVGLSSLTVWHRTARLPRWLPILLGLLLALLLALLARSCGEERPGPGPGPGTSPFPSRPGLEDRIMADASGT